ncbi:hypothetical protein AAC387_Pa03g1796 [Persea americana]
MTLDGEKGRLRLAIEVGCDEAVQGGPVIDVFGLVNRVRVWIVVGDEIGGLITGIHLEWRARGALKRW